MAYLYNISIRPRRALEIVLRADFDDNKTPRQIYIMIFICTIMKYPMTGLREQICCFAIPGKPFRYRYSPALRYQYQRNQY